MPVLAIAAGLLLFLAAGLFALWWKHRRTWSGLTDHHAFVATVGVIAVRKPQDFWLHPGQEIELHRTEPAPVIFQRSVVPKGGSSRYFETGFKQIAEAEKVYRLMQDCPAKWNEMEV